MKHLIVTADDFGLTRSMNEGIARAFEEGVVTSINLMPSGEAFEDAKSRARKLGLKEIGVHLALTETKPALKASPGRFCKNHKEFFLKFFLGAIDRDDIYPELKEQLDMAASLGVKITHLSSHEHIHMVPAVLKYFIRLAKEYSIPAIRYLGKDRNVSMAEPGKFYRSFLLSCLAPGAKKMLDASGVRYPEHFMGFVDSGRLSERLLGEMLRNLEDGVTEIVSHPGLMGPEIQNRYRFQRYCETELSALTSAGIRRLIEDNGIKLISYGEFLQM